MRIEYQRREWLRGGIVPLDYPEPVAADWPELIDDCRKESKAGAFGIASLRTIGDEMLQVVGGST